MLPFRKKSLTSEKSAIPHISSFLTASSEDKINCFLISDFQILFEFAEYFMVLIDTSRGLRQQIYLQYI